MVSVFHRHRICLVISASLACSTVAVAQPHLRGQAAGGYAAGIDSPVLRDGSRSWRTSVWLDRASGAEFGLAIGQDQSEDRTQRTPGLFFDPVGRGTGTQQCVGCLPGTASVRTTMSAWYLAPSVSLRQRDGAVRPYLTLALGAYRVRDVRDTRFLPSSGAAAVGRSVVSSSKWTAGAHAGLGAEVPIARHVAVDFSSMLHGAALIGNDYAGGTAYAVFAVGVMVR